MPRPRLDPDGWGKITRSKTPNGIHSAAAYYRDLSGVRRRMTRTGKSFADAERNLISALKSRSGTTANANFSGQSGIEEVALVWFDELREKGVKTATQYNYSAIMRRIIVPQIGGFTISELSVPRLDQWFKRVRATNGYHSAVEVRKIVRSILSVAVRYGAISENPVPKTAPILGKSSEPKAPTLEDIILIRQLFTKYDDGNVRVRMLPPLDMLIGTGMRTGELMALKWEDLHLDDGLVAISRTVAIGEDGNEYVQESTKSRDSTRTLNLGEHVVNMLRGLPRRSEYVFPSSRRNVQLPSNFRSRWRGILKGTPFEGVTPRSMRKAVATILARELGSGAAAAQLGHSSDMVTKRHYIEPTHLGPETLVLGQFFQQEGE